MHPAAARVNINLIPLVSLLSLGYEWRMSKTPATPSAPETMIRKNVGLPNSMWQEIADYRFAERIGSEAEAVRRLIVAGLRAEKRKGAKG
jgi:hypothetical protein